MVARKWYSIVDGKKKCIKCGIWLPIDVFYQRKNNFKGSGLTSTCKNCGRSIIREYVSKNGELIRRKVKSHRIKHLYKISEQDYSNIWENQDGKCAICGIHENDINFGSYHQLYIDHDKISGKVRGLLCHYCNVALGSFKDNIDSLKHAIEYLESR